MQLQLQQQVFQLQLEEVVQQPQLQELTMVMVHLQFFQQLHQQEVELVNVNKLQADLVGLVVVEAVEVYVVQMEVQAIHLQLVLHKDNQVMVHNLMVVVEVEVVQVQQEVQDQDQVVEMVQMVLQVKLQQVQ